MIQALVRAFGAFGEVAVRRLFWIGVLGALATQILLFLVLGYLIARLRIVGADWGIWSDWAEWGLDLLSGAALLLLVWITFPGTIGIVTGLLLERVAHQIEVRHYPSQPPAREQGVWEAVRLALNFALVSIGLNLLALPIYFFLPVINLLVFYALNGYLLGREYFELVALRRLDGSSAQVLRKSYQGTIFLSGAVIAFLTTVPLLNLAAPVVATAFMVHLFETLRRRVGMVQSA
ncbi:MAG TPA: EI24 domain-containing protein [Alphaproteobacteria bacterium]|nr:EI24 domain-containing protein [Alphaproteobacteria bacterium]